MGKIGEETRGVRFGPKVDQISPKWDKFGTFQITVLFEP